MAHPGSSGGRTSTRKRVVRILPANAACFDRSAFFQVRNEFPACLGAGQAAGEGLCKLRWHEEADCGPRNSAMGKCQVPSQCKPTIGVVIGGPARKLITATLLALFGGRLDFPVERQGECAANRFDGLKDSDVAHTLVSLGRPFR
jgi:hypothetical protein